MENVADGSNDVIAFIDSLRRLFDSVQEGTEDENHSIPLDYLEWRLDGYLQIVQSMAVVMHTSNVTNDITLMIDNLVEVMLSLLQNIEETRVSRERNERTCRSWQLTTLESSGGRPRYRITKEQIETLRETGMNWKSIATALGISESTLYWRRQEYGLQDSFVTINDEDLCGAVVDILGQTPYAGEHYVGGGLRARGIFVQRYRVRAILQQIDPVGRALHQRTAIQ